MSLATITVPASYGYVILTTVVGGLFVTPTVLGGLVMTARKDCDVPYPNLYATPGVHKKADQFNRIQRGHQNMFESLTAFGAANLLGGLRHPLACTAFAVMYSVGCYLYLLGYSDISLDVATARYKKGAAIKVVGVLGAVGACISFAAQISGWW